mmetsp:Transcript_39389/g.92603  ORF Transcript_39389/g.92603 Transcript_39389/m.92603 type:complete len:433 (-) Transcript_39389:304-1602(-)
MYIYDPTADSAARVRAARAYRDIGVRSSDPNQVFTFRKVSLSIAHFDVHRLGRPRLAIAELVVEEEERLCAEHLRLGCAGHAGVRDEEPARDRLHEGDVVPPAHRALVDHHGRQRVRVPAPPAARPTPRRLARAELPEAGGRLAVRGAEGRELKREGKGHVPVHLGRAPLGRGEALQVERQRQRRSRKRVPAHGGLAWLGRLGTRGHLELGARRAAVAVVAGGDHLFGEEGPEAAEDVALRPVALAGVLLEPAAPHGVQCLCDGDGAHKRLRGRRGRGRGRLRYVLCSGGAGGPLHRRRGGGHTAGRGCARHALFRSRSSRERRRRGPARLACRRIAPVWHALRGAQTAPARRVDWLRGLRWARPQLSGQLPVRGFRARVVVKGHSLWPKLHTPPRRQVVAPPCRRLRPSGARARARRGPGRPCAAPRCARG